MLKENICCLFKNKLYPHFPVFQLYFCLFLFTYGYFCVLFSVRGVRLPFSDSVHLQLAALFDFDFVKYF